MRVLLGLARTGKLTREVLINVINAANHVQAYSGNNGITEIVRNLLSQIVCGSIHQTQQYQCNQLFDLNSLFLRQVQNWHGNADKQKASRDVDRAGNVVKHYLGVDAVSWILAHPTLLNWGAGKDANKGCSSEEAHKNAHERIINNPGYGHRSEFDAFEEVSIDKAEREFAEHQGEFGEDLNKPEHLPTLEQI